MAECRLVGAECGLVHSADLVSSAETQNYRTEDFRGGGGGRLGDLQLGTSQVIDSSRTVIDTYHRR